MVRDLEMVVKELEVGIKEAFNSLDIYPLTATCLMGVLFIADAIFALILVVAILYVLITGNSISFGLKFWVYLFALVFVTVVSTRYFFRLMTKYAKAAREKYPSIVRPPV